jgi:mono/diheme cytochrome c family protein
MSKVLLTSRVWATVRNACFILLISSSAIFSQEESLYNRGVVIAPNTLQSSLPGPIANNLGPQTLADLPVVPAYSPPTIDASITTVQHTVPNCGCNYCRTSGEGSWNWIRDEVEERRRAIRIYNVQCVRCHGVQGKGVWDIPDVPNFTNRRWQQSRSDADIVRLTLSGRGACMPAFKGTITTDEAWAIARYIRALGQPAIERETTDDQREKAKEPKKDAAEPKKNASDRSEDAGDEKSSSDKDSDSGSAEEIKAATPIFLRSR